MSDISSTDYDNSSEIAIIGMAGRFPGASNVDAFWRNLCDGVESIARLTDEELKASGVSPALFSLPTYVKAASILDDIETFDASFFGYSPREAELIDPQQRLFLECAWEALEKAGYDPEKYQGAVGVFAGAKTSTYLFNLFANPDLIQSLDIMEIGLGNDSANLTTRVSYKLNLKGPSYSVHTACSTSLIAVHLACQSLLVDECQLALAGGVAVNVPHKVGYVYQPRGITSPDGHCRPFDARAQGTLFGSGVGVVVLKRLADALDDGDNILAVIKGTAANNDGSHKASFTAPGVEGQTRVVLDALANAMVNPAQIGYVEAHGTGTLLGDAIEIRALKRAYRTNGTSQKQLCAIGSVKSNVGHLDTAAGIASLIKTVLALQHKRLPPSLHYEEPNPQIDFEPFYVNTQLIEWRADNGPRRAGVSSFGFGSTNAHVILEEAPQPEPSSASRPYQLLLISAQSHTALDTATGNLIAHFNQYPNLNLADVSHTLQIGRRAFSHRRMVVARGLDEAAGLLATLDGLRVFTGVQENVDRPVVFMCTGQGSQYPNMGLELYETEIVFREAVDQCAELLKPHLGLDLRSALYPGTTNDERRTTNDERPPTTVRARYIVPQQGDKETRRQGEGEAETQHSTLKTQNFSSILDQTALAQPALFVMEYALAQLWMAWGVKPQAMIGHSIGEYVAACLAGVLTLEDALELVAIRGRLMQSVPAGAMLAVSLNEEAVQPFLGNGCSLAAVNTATLSVVSGPVEAIESLQKQLDERGIGCRRLRASHAFHSSMMDSILEPFTEAVKRYQLKPPKIPYISNVTGTWIEAVQATDPAYWARQLRQPVRFAQGVGELAKEPERVLLELGPGQTLGTFARQLTDRTTGQLVLTSLRHPQEAQSDVAFILNTIGRLWLAGVEIDWTGFYAAERRHRVPLPMYPFERQRFWVEPQNQNARIRWPGMASQKNDVAEWFYLPSWKRAPALPPAALEQLAGTPGSWVIFADSNAVSRTLLRGLQSAGQEVVLVVASDAFGQTSETEYTIHPGRPEDYRSLCSAIFARPHPPTRLVHCWSLAPEESALRFDWAQERGFYSLLYLAQAVSAANIVENIRLDIVSDHLFSVTGEESLQPEKATLLGPCMVIPQEYSNLTCHVIDITGQAGLCHEQMAERLLSEMVVPTSELIVSYRGKHRWVQTFDVQRLESAPLEKTRLRPRGVYLITGGLGEIGLILAEVLARRVQARLVLLGRSAFPARGEWESWLASHAEDDVTSRRIYKLLDIEAKGGEVLILRADVADAEQTEQAVAQAYAHFGQLHGVIHAAGLVGEKASQFISETRPSQVEEHFHVKIHGLIVLERVLRGPTLDFGIVISSLATVLGGLGTAAYAAANAFMDAFVQQHQDAATPWLSINWDAWKLGKEEERNQMLEAFVNRAITPDEGAEAFLRILTLSAMPQVVVSTTDLQGRIDQWIRREGLHAGGAVSGTLHARPSLPVAYAAPHNEFEQNVAAVWQQVLGIEQVGINDSFFDLGGHSLLITQLLNRLHKIYPIELSMRSLFENPTVASMARVIERMYQETGGQIRPILERFREAAPPEQQQLVETYLHHSIAQSLNLAPEDIAMEEEREEFGIEIVIGNLQWEFQRDFRLQLYSSEIRAQKTVRGMAGFVIGELNRLAALRNVEATAPISLYEHYEQQVVAQPARINSWIKPEQKNERMLFLHGTPRSGSTLLRVMLAGHPDLFCPPELDILRCSTVSEWTDSLTDPTSTYGFIWATQGLEWAFIDLTGLDAESVRLYIRGMADDQVSVQEVYAKLQELASPRLLVDKTPQYSLRLETLLRTEELFESPKHILLIRHPYSVIESWARIRMDKLFGPVIYGSSQVDSHVVAEKVWVLCYRNLLEFSRRVGPQRCRFVRYEDLVGDPRRTMTALCEFLELPFDEAVLQPYDNKSERMITGIGDPNIIYHDRIDPNLGLVWKTIKLPHLLGEPARELATQFGYELPAEADAGLIAVAAEHVDA